MHLATQWRFKPTDLEALAGRRRAVAVRMSTCRIGKEAPVLGCAGRRPWTGHGGSLRTGGIHARGKECRALDHNLGMVRIHFFQQINK